MRPSTLATVVGCAILIVVALGAVRREAGPPATGWPELAELDSLSRYLAPVGPAPDPDEYGAFIPARPPPVRAARPTAPPSRHRLSAILITGSRRLAIIDDTHVRPGDRLQGETVVLSIGRDHVVVRQRDGSLRTLRLSTATERLR